MKTRSIWQHKHSWIAVENSRKNDGTRFSGLDARLTLPFGRQRGPHIGLFTARCRDAGIDRAGRRASRDQADLRSGDERRGAGSQAVPADTCRGARAQPRSLGATATDFVHAACFPWGTTDRAQGQASRPDEPPGRVSPIIPPPRWTPPPRTAKHVARPQRDSDL